MSTAVDAIRDRATASSQQKAGATERPALTVGDLLKLLAQRWRFLVMASLLGAVVGLALAFLLPVRYTAITTILPPAPSSSLSTAFAAQSGGLGALASLTGSSFGFHNPADTCLIMLRSRTVEDAVIHRFNLMQEYHKKRLSDTRTALERMTSVTLNVKSGVIAISARDRDAARAAELANGYVEEFRKFTASLAITEASQRRLFFEQQIQQARGALNQAEEDLKTTQLTTGMLDPAGASKASLESAVALRAQVAEKEVELRTMRTYATEENPVLVQVKQEIAALESQLAGLTGASQETAADPLIPKGRIPEAGAEYLRKLRDVKYNESVVAILARELEIARLDEARQGSVVQVVDIAVAPDKRSSPKRLVTLLACTIFAFCIASFWVSYSWRGVSSPGNRTVGNIAVLSLVLLASSYAVAAQTPEMQTQSPDCSSSQLDAQGSLCPVQEQGAPVMPARPVSSEDRSVRWTNDGRTGPEAHTRTEDSARNYTRRLDVRNRPAQPPEPQTEFEQMAADTAGRPLNVFGRSLFAQPPETFAPAGNIQVPSDYVLGPGDEIYIQMWGQIEANLRIEVDRSGQIFIPHVGDVSVAGVRYGDLESYLKHMVERVYKSFSLAVSIGRLHSIQVFVVGQATAPGVYTISSLSTLINAVFASGGPSAQGSLRNIELRRGGHSLQEFDLYDLLIKGDKSHDIPLQSGDVVFIRPVGPLVAIAGSVDVPAIYELKGGATLGSLVETAGGLNSLADRSSVTVERIREDQARSVLQFPLDEKGQGFELKGGDVIRISSIVPRFDDTVTLRGYVANPGRYPFVAGMRVRDLLPNAQAVLPREYWLNRASTTDARQTEYPVRKKVAAPQLSARTPDQPGDAVNTMPQPNQPAGASGVTQMRQQTIPEYYKDLARSETVGDPEPDEPMLGSKVGDSLRDNGKDLLTRDLLKLVPSVNWRYALIQRVDAATLKTQLISFDLGRAIVDGDAQSNLALEPGDIVTVFSQHDIVAPQQAQTRYVKVEGEVEHPGVYEVTEGQTLQDLLQTAGGLTAEAYPYGARLTRESARLEQQRGLDQMVRTAEAEMRASTVTAVASATQDSSAVSARQAAQQSLLASLQSLRASGRVVLAMRPEADTPADFPPLPLEDGDRIVVPARSNTVTVSGAVYNPASFVYDSRRSVGDYLQLAGKGGLNSNQRHAFVLRADGTVISRQETGGFLHNGFEQLPMHPGDQIVVPEKVDNGVVRALHDWPQILSPLALSALAIATVAK